MNRTLVTLLSLAFLGALTAPVSSQAQSTAYVTNFLSSNVTPIDVATNTAGTPIPVGDDPSGIAITPAPLQPAVEPGPDGHPGTHNLSAVYPNPFNPQANFTLQVAEQQSVRVSVYDALGREVATLFNGTLGAGPEHAFTINGAGLPSGVYLVRATGEQFTDGLSVTLLK